MRRISKDALRIIVRNLQGDRFTVAMLQGILQEVVLDGEGLLSCEELARCLRRPDPAPEPQEAKRYDLAEKKGLAGFLIDADIRLVRADFILKLQREGQRLPRRQEAESAYVHGRTALVTHEEVQAWADSGEPEDNAIVSVSHCWESKEHCDPYGYQLARLANSLTGKEWFFIDYVSLYQAQRLLRQQNVSFGRAMQNMHVLYCHDKSSTLRIESLTPEADIEEAEQKHECVSVYNPVSGLVKTVPVTQLIKNRTPYRERGWCAAEREWSCTRTATNLTREVDTSEGEKGGSAPMAPEAFRENVAHRLKFTHKADVETVCSLQAEVYKEKAKVCRSLRLVDLGADALDIALSALEHYPALESLEIVHCELSPKLPLVLKVLKEKKLPQLHLQHNELLAEGTCQVVEARRQMPMCTAGMALAVQLAALSLSHDRIGVAGVKALAEALRTKKALIELNLSHVCLDGDGVSALAEAITQNRTLKRLSIGANLEIAEECAFALLEAGILNLLPTYSLRASALRVSGVEAQLQLDLKDSDSGKAAVALARALRTGQVKGTVTHPAMEFLCMLEDFEFEKLEEAPQKFFLDLNHLSHGAESFRRLFGPLCRALPKLPEPLRELELDLHGTEGAGALASAIGVLENLQKLSVNLKNNKICLGPRLCDAGAKALATAVSSLKELQDVSLNLEMCDMGTEGAGALASAIGVLENLQKLSVNLKNNKICLGPRLRDAGAKALATAVSSLKELQDVSLNLEMCDMGEEGLLSLLEAGHNSLCASSRPPKPLLPVECRCLWDSFVFLILMLSGVPQALRATSPASTQLDLGDLAENDIGKGAFALARALRSGEAGPSEALQKRDPDIVSSVPHFFSLFCVPVCNQVKGRVTHPVVEFLAELEARAISSKCGKFFIFPGSAESSAEGCCPSAMPLPGISARSLGAKYLPKSRNSQPWKSEALPTRATFARHARSFPCASWALFGQRPGVRAATAAATVQDEQLKELEEAPQKLKLDLRGYSRRLSSGAEAPPMALFRGEAEAERFRRLFGPLCRALPKLPEPLRELQLELWSHGAAGARALAAGLRHQKELQTLTLFLGNNFVGQEGAKSLASALRELTQLKTLVLSLNKNNIGSAGATALVESLRELRQLTNLLVDLQNNRLSPGLGRDEAASSALPQKNPSGPGKEEKKKLRAALNALPVAKKIIRL
ncbi:Nlrc3 [Symbiodinium sp. CCMP2592]|nr:Nlrc3 [Symbiodinium sp. CCMP2592]